MREREEEDRPGRVVDSRRIVDLAVAAILSSFAAASSASSSSGSRNILKSAISVNKWTVWVYSWKKHNADPDGAQARTGAQGAGLQNLREQTHGNPIVSQFARSSRRSEALSITGVESPEMQ
jgi:hypothetical protein